MYHEENRKYLDNLNIVHLQKNVEEYSVVRISLNTRIACFIF